MSNTLLVDCPCGIPFVVTRRWLQDHPQGIWICSGMVTTKDGKHEFCKRQYSVVRLENEFWRGTWSPENEITE
jgi:hypothetical protein